MLFALGLALAWAVVGRPSFAEEAPIRLPAAALEHLRDGSKPYKDDVGRAVTKALEPILLPVFEDLFAAEGADLRIPVMGVGRDEGGGTLIHALCYAQKEAGPHAPWSASVFLRVDEAAGAEVAKYYRAWHEKLERNAPAPTRRAMGARTAFADHSFNFSSAFRLYRWFADDDHMMIVMMAEKALDAWPMAERLDKLLAKHGIYDLRRRLVGAAAPLTEGLNLRTVSMWDANPLYLGGVPVEQLADPGRLVAALTETRLGVAADGVSAVVLRLDLSAPGVARLSVEDDQRPFDDGQVSMLFAGRTVELQGDRGPLHAAFALYRPPRSFEEPRGRLEDGEEPAPAPAPRPRLGDVVAWRAARLTLALGANAGALAPLPAGLDVPLVRPPTLLVHGTFDDAVECWERSAGEGPAEPSAGSVSMAGALRREGHAVFLVDFRETNGSDHGRPADSGFTSNARTLWSAPGGAFDALRTYRQGLRVAAAQVDVVGHSLGGLVARLWASQEYNPPRGGGEPVFDRERSAGFLRPDNFGRGDIHRLVTIATPHQGSDFADLALALEEMPAPLRTAMDKLLWRAHDDRPEAKWLLERAAIQWLRLAEGYGVSPVVRDQRAFLPESPNEALRRLGPTPVPSHAVVCAAAVPDVERFGATYKMPLRAAAWWMLNARPVELGRFLERRGQGSEVARLYGEAEDAAGVGGGRGGRES
jgi:hypothetical protein